MELGVLGWLTTSSPLMRFTCLLTEMVMLSTSKSVHRRASSSPPPQAGGQFQIKGRQQTAPLRFSQIRADLVLRQYLHR